jgi:hypothetical protein
VDGAAAVQAKNIWLVSGATVTLNLLRKSMPRMDLPQRLAKTAKKKVCPEIGQFFERIPKRGWVVHPLL